MIRHLIHHAAVTILVIVIAGCAVRPPVVVPTPTESAVPTPTSAATLSPTILPSPTISASPTIPATPAPSPTPTPAPTVQSTASGYTIATLLPLLTVAPEHIGGYDRDLFGSWIDADQDGCNTRKEVLLRDAVVAPKVEPGCYIDGGQWLSPYDGVTLTDYGQIQIDHVVALAEAWRSGAWAWDSTRREQFANDLDAPELIAVDGSINESKSDYDPAEWLPPQEDFVCTYLADWLAVKARWELSLDPVEEQAIADQTSCANAPVVVTLP